MHTSTFRRNTLKSGATIRMSSARTLLGRKPAPVMASFSSRGPNKIQPAILKVSCTSTSIHYYHFIHCYHQLYIYIYKRDSLFQPDVTAPGVNILAAFSEFASASNLPTDTRHNFKFNVMQGTSMSCPHVTGIAGLIKTLHPSWSPAAIKSAIMTTGAL